MQKQSKNWPGVQYPLNLTTTPLTCKVNSFLEYRPIHEEKAHRTSLKTTSHLSSYTAAATHV